MIIDENGNFGRGEEVENATLALARVRRLEAVLAVVVAVFMVGAAVFLIWNSQRNRDSTARIEGIAHKIEDCSSENGDCYRRNQDATKKAIDAILEGFKGQLDPFSLRNEAENICQVEAFAGLPAYATKGVSAALAFYDECVKRRSRGISVPPLPPNPLATTTTTTEGKP